MPVAWCTRRGLSATDAALHLLRAWLAVAVAEQESHPYTDVVDRELLTPDEVEAALSVGDYQSQDEEEDTDAVQQ